MWHIHHRPSAASGSLPHFRSVIGVLLSSMLACTPDRVTAPEPQLTVGHSQFSSATDECLTCSFGPEVYTRQTGTPVTNAGRFAGNPAGAYIIEIDNLGTQGSNASVVLNGEPLDVRSGYLRQAVTLKTDNELLTRLTGKPGSKLAVKIFQEVHSVTVTPNLDHSRIPATQQFTAVARDANGVAIPNQTFAWISSNTTIATINANSGVATTRGAVNNNIAWTYETISTGEGTAQIVARAIGTTVDGSVPWRILAGFVYTTFRAALPLNSPNRASRPNSVGLRYDESRLNTMVARCQTENGTTQWLDYETGEGLFFQCFPTLELTTLVRNLLPIVGYVFHEVPNVGLYGRYCGAGHPGGDFIVAARNDNYQPKDPIDAMCMEHDRQNQSHELKTDDLAQNIEATCIVRYGIEAETLHEDGALIAPGSARWNTFWLAHLPMAQARAHFLAATRETCTDDTVLPGGIVVPGVYRVFLLERGLNFP
jgi:hypothetical protein